MEKQIYDLFESETMPADCAKRIERTLNAPAAGTRPCWIRAAVIAVVAVVILFWGFREEIIHVSADFYDYIIHIQSPEETAPLGEVMTDVYVSYGGTKVSESKNSAAASISSGLTFPAEVRDGRLCFIANGENIDITDQCSMDTAYIYTMQDKTGIIHHIIVGGTPDNWGYCVIMYHPVQDRWIGGAGHNHCGEASDWETYGWVKDAKEKLNHPFPV